MEAVSVQPHSFSADTTWADSWFKAFPTDLRFNKVIYHQYLPLNTLANVESVLFTIPMWSSGSYILLDKALMSVRFHVENGAGAAIVAGKKASLTNNILHTLFGDIKMSMNDQPIFPTSSNSHYKAYMHNLLNFSEDCKSSWLQSQGWYTDQPGFFNDINGSNSGWEERQMLFTSMSKASTPVKSYNKKTIHLVGPFLSDFNDGQQVVNGVSLKFEFTLNKNSIIFMAENGADARVVIESMELYVPSAELNVDIHLKVEKLLHTKPYEISFRRKEIQVFQIPLNSSIFLTDNLWLNKTLPSRLFLQFVKTSAFLGAYTENCFEFVRDVLIDETTPANNCSIKSCELYINGSLADGLPSSEIFDFFRLNETLQMNNSSQSNHISIKDFKGGNCIFGFDLTTSHNATLGLVTPATRRGNLRLQIVFTKATPIAVTGLMFAESPSVISIDQNRRVTMNYLS